MSKLTLSEGTRNITKDLVEATVYEQLITRLLTHGDSTKGRVKLSTIANLACCTEGEVIKAIESLKTKGLIEVDTSEYGLKEGALLGVKLAKIHASSHMPQQPSLEEADEDDTEDSDDDF